MADCNTCREAREMIPRHVHESALDRMERMNKRWFVAWLITFVLLVGCVAGFIWYESQLEVIETYQEVEQEADGNGTNNFIGGNYYGEADSQDEDSETGS